MGPSPNFARSTLSKSCMSPHACMHAPLLTPAFPKHLLFFSPPLFSPLLPSSLLSSPLLSSPPLFSPLLPSSLLSSPLLSSPPLFSPLLPSSLLSSPLLSSPFLTLISFNALTNLFFPFSLVRISLSLRPLRPSFPLLQLPPLPPPSLLLLLLPAVRDLSGNHLSGQIFVDFKGLVKLTVLNLRDNHLTGRLPKPPPNIRQYQLDNNFFAYPFFSPPNCSVISIRGNCVPLSNLSLTCPGDKQRHPEVCLSFCGLTASKPPCSDRGICLLEGPSKVPVCKCHGGKVTGEYRGSCVPAVGGLALVSLQPVEVSSALLTTSGSASVDGATKSFTLTPLQAGASGAVFLSERVPLFSYQLIADGCGRELAFSSSFSFTLTRASATASGTEGFAFVIAFDATAPAEAVAGGMGYAGMAARSVAVEFDTWQDGGSGGSGGEPGGNHVGVNVDGRSVATAAAPTPLNDGTPKYAWIEYDPSAPPDAAAPTATAAAASAAAGSLRVFLSSHPSPRPAKPVLSVRVSLCDILQPTSLENKFAVGFTAASGSQAQRHAVSAWNFTTSFPQSPTKRGGLRVSEAAISPAASGMNLLFRYASSGILPPPQEGNDHRNQYDVRVTSTWLLQDLFWPVKTQTACGDSWAYAVVGSIEAAYSIMANLSVAPQLSALQLRSSMRADCQGGSPSQAFAFLLKAARSKAAVRGRNVTVNQQERRHLNDGRGHSKALVWRGGTANTKQVRSRLCMAPFVPLFKLLGISCDGKGATKQQALTGDFYITGFESTAFYGWFGLLLAVQRQPVVVQIEATAPSFQEYDGLHKYQDPACFTYNLNHVVLLVGYHLAGKDSRFPNMAPPFWIIRNSWGAAWGDGGHMRMDIQGGDGVCGINTLPGIYPIVRAASDPCNTAARSDASGSLFNPCGSFTCVVDGSSNRCNCTDPRFIEATNADGSRTCAYGTFSCAPGDTRSQYTLLAPNIFCSDIYPVYGLTRDNFTTLNPAVNCLLPPPTVNCIEPLPVGLTLNVTLNPGLAPCTVYYTTVPDDTCQSIGAYFNLNDCRSKDPSCATVLQSLNPGLICQGGTQVQANQAVCVERRAGAAGKGGQVIPVCSQYYLVQNAETCDEIRSVPNPPLSPLEFFRLNPGIKCNRLVPDAAGLDLHTGFEQVPEAVLHGLPDLTSCMPSSAQHTASPTFSFPSR
ncbi:unnamed protein product [Closterium sp. NIES-64]|nr:unnamed protein product [Closterium sp. NIES-64]